MKIAFISRQENAYSESFIQAQINGLSGEIFYFWNMGSTTTDGSIYNQIGLSYNNALKKQFVSKKIDVVLAQYGMTGVKVLDVCEELSIPLIVHFHGFDAYKFSSLELYKVEYKRLFSYCSNVIAVSKDMVRKLVSLGATKSKIIYAPCAPSDDFYSIIPKFRNIVFISVGRFVNKKGPYYTMAAFKLVLEKHPKAILVMVGNGEQLLETCINLAEMWGILDKVKFLGELEHEMVKKIYSKAYCFVQHSVTGLDGDAEGTPVSIMEASAAGLPIVATKHKGINDVVKNGISGYLVDEKDHRAMAFRMIELIENRKLAREMGSNGRLFIKRNFTMNSYISKIQFALENSCALISQK